MPRLRTAALAALAWLAAGSALADGYLRLEGHGGPVKGVAIAPGGATALTASFDYTARLWSLGDATGGAWLRGHRAAVNAGLFHPDGQRVLTVGDDFALMVWQRATGAPIARLEGHRGKLVALALAPDGRTVATAGWDGWIGLWDIGEGRHLGWLEGHRGAVNDLAFRADGTLISAGYDGRVLAWPADGGTPRPLVRHGFGVNRLALDETAGWLAYGGVDGAIRVIDLASGATLADLTTERRPILAMALSPGRAHLAIGDGEGHVLIAATADWSVERDFRAAVRGPVWALAWTADATRLLTGGIDDAAALWPVAAPPDGAVLATAERSFLRDPETMDNGERQFARKCSVCHTLSPDGANRAGPTLWRLFGRPAGSVAGYDYSPALRDTGIVWGADTIDRLFRDGPDHYTPGSKMPMQRIAAASDRRDLVEFLARNTGPGADSAAETAGETKR